MAVEKVSMDAAAKVVARVAAVDKLATELERHLGELVGEARAVHKPGLALLAGDLRMTLRDAAPKLDRAEDEAAELAAEVVRQEALERAGA